MRLIDADALRHEIPVDKYGHIETTITKLIIAIEHSEVDAVQIVRCKDCRWGRKVCGCIECSIDSKIPTEYHGYKWFCPNGERRNE